MKLAKASPEEVDALLNLMRVLNTADGENMPCKPDGTWDDGEDDYFDPSDRDHLRIFYDRVMACFADHPGGLTRTIGGYHLAMTNDVFDPDADSYEWHPDIQAARADSKRLDWLANPDNPLGNVTLPAGAVLENVESLRAAIDAAMTGNYEPHAPIVG